MNPIDSQANRWMQRFDPWLTAMVCLPVPAATTVSGGDFTRPRYHAARFSDGSVVCVIETEPGGPWRVMDWSAVPITQWAFETLIHAARCVTCLTPEHRAECVRRDGTIQGGVRWGADGSYRGLDLTDWVEAYSDGEHRDVERQMLADMGEARP